MGLPSQQFSIWARLIRRFILEPSQLGASEHPNVDTTIWPTTDADELLRTTQLENVALPGATTGDTVAFTVPAGEKWLVYALGFERSAGDRTITRFRVVDGASEIIIDTFAAANFFRSGMFNQPIPMNEGWLIDFSLGAGTTDGQWDVQMLRTTEEAFETPS